MITIIPNKSFLLDMKNRYNQNIEKDLFDFFDYMLSDEIQPVTVQSQKDLTKHIAHVRLNLLYIHNTNHALRHGQVPNDDDLGKYKFTPIEIVCLILTYLPIVRLKLTDNRNKKDFAVFNYFEPHAGTYQYDMSYFDQLIFIISPNISINRFKSCHSILATLVDRHVEQRQNKEDNNSAIEFWNEFENQFAWDFLPQKFLYPLYVAWFTEEHAGEKSNCFSKKTFLNHLQNYLENKPNWNFKATHATSPNPIRIGNRMNADEPLITRYRLTNFYDPSYKGTDPALKRNFQRVDRGRGIIRI